MKKLNICLSIIAALFVFGACSNDDDDNIIVKVPASITDVVATPDYGSVRFTWTNPAEADFSYVEISYINNLGTIINVSATEGADEAIVDGFVDINSYEFKLKAVDNEGNRSEAATISATPNAPAYQVVMETVSVELEEEEVIVSWTNETEKAVTIVVEYTDEAAEVQKNDVDAAQTGTSKITDLSTETPTVTIYTIDVFDNETDPKEFKVEFPVDDMLAKDLWTVHGFSSEEPAEGGGNGLVTATFDDDLNTFWHTDWANLAPDYPHYFSINMGETHSVKAFDCSRRQGDERGQTKIQFLGSSDGENWTDLGTFDFDADSDDAQRFDVTPTDMQYFKYVALEGNDTFAFLAEINIYRNK